MGHLLRKLVSHREAERGVARQAELIDEAKGARCSESVVGKNLIARSADHASAASLPAVSSLRASTSRSPSVRISACAARRASADDSGGNGLSPP